MSARPVIDQILFDVRPLSPNGRPVRMAGKSVTASVSTEVLEDFEI